MFQNDRLMPWRTAIDNVALGLSSTRCRAKERRDIAAAWLDAAWPRRPRKRFSACAVGRHAPARLDRPRLCRQARHPALRRAVFRARRAHRQRAARRNSASCCAQTGATAIFITHSIEEALWLGGRLMVFERPARIAYEAALGARMSEAERKRCATASARCCPRKAQRTS